MPSDELIDTIADEMKEYSPEKGQVEDSQEEDMAEPADEFVVEVGGDQPDTVKSEESLAVVVEESEEREGVIITEAEAAQMEGVTLIQAEDGQEVLAAEGAGGDDIVIQIMTPDGQIVTTTTKQSDLMQTLQLEGGVEAGGEQTFVLQTGDETVQFQSNQFQVLQLGNALSSHSQ